GGKDKTSVGPSFPRNRLFSTRNSRLVVTSTFTVPRKRAARFARATNRSSADSLSPATRFRKITIQVASASCRLSVVLRSRKLFLGILIVPERSASYVLPILTTCIGPSLRSE